MAQGKPGSILWPLALIVIGAGWLLHRLDVLPSVSWIIILGLIAAGVAVLLLEGLNKSSIVLGPMLIAGGGHHVCAAIFAAGAQCAGTALADLVWFADATGPLT
ncbi:hypothetical protein [Chitinibacter sp. ZOR0017]|uniref:hypothetical protein n=1 Tax=Chitinibacter sp. ZOR0017 TaxID=1339254 RepID=UPI00068B5CB8|nr:hypothetical protein [Chitinibacter sp. ZOR0017]